MNASRIFRIRHARELWSNILKGDQLGNLGAWAVHRRWGRGVQLMPVYLSCWLRKRDLEVTFVKSEHSCITSDSNEASLRLIICKKLGDGKADRAVRPFNSPSADSRCRDQRRSGTKRSLSVPSAHQSVFSSLTQSSTRSVFCPFPVP